jgi:hypothetical protein
LGVQAARKLITNPMESSLPDWVTIGAAIDIVVAAAILMGV